MHQHFGTKWEQAHQHKPHEEWTLFVPQGKKSLTQRQFNLYNYYQFIHSIIDGKGYRNAVELGCGRGTLALYLHKYENMAVACTDVEQSAIDLARRNFEHHGGQAEFFVRDAAALGVPDNSYDVVVSIGLLEHLHDFVPVLKEEYRILKPGGVMISLNIPKKKSAQQLNEVYRWFLRRLGTSYELKPDYFRTAATPEEFKKQSADVGFVNLSTVNVNPYPIFVPISKKWEQRLAYVYRAINATRGLFMRYPFKTNRPCSQAHFLVGYKPK